MNRYVPVKRDSVAVVGTEPVPAKPYHDPGYFQLERDAIFRRVWLHIGRTSEISDPGQFIVRSLEVANTSILVTHGLDGTLRAFHNVCTHRGTELVGRPAGKAASFSCRYHSWTFGADGALRAIPDEAAFFGVDKSKCGLREVALDTCGGFIFINLEAPPRQSLREFLGVWADRLEALHLGAGEVYAEYVYDVEANWKTTHNNFQEIYHGRFVHANSIGSASQTPDNPFGYPTGYTFSEGMPHSDMKLWNNPDYSPTAIERLSGSILRKSDEERGVVSSGWSSDFISIFPNLTLLARTDRCFTQTIWPVGVDRTRSVIRQYWSGKDTNASLRFAREHTLASTLDVHSEDRDIIEAAHRGLKSGAIDVVHFQTHEAMLRHHFNAVDRYVETYKREVAARGAERPS